MQDNTYQLQNLIANLNKRDDSSNLNSCTVPTITTSDSQLGAEAFLACIKYVNSVWTSNILSRMLGGPAEPPGKDKPAISIAKQLLANGLSPNTIHEGEPLIFGAISESSDSSTLEEFTTMLIEHGADLDVTNKDGNTPLGAHLSNRVATDRSVAPYKSKGARVNARDFLDPAIRTAACQLGAEVSPAAFADIASSRQARGTSTPLFDACYYDRVDIVSQLLDAGADPNERSFVDCSGGDLLESMTPPAPKPGVPLEIAWAVFERGLSKAADPSFFHQMGYGVTNLYYPALNGQEVVVHRLLKAGADPNAISFHGLFPLYVAAEIGALGIVKDLVDHGADINKTTPKLCTSLLNAAEEGKLDVVRYLLDKGADPSIRNSSGTSPADAALRAGYPDIARYINNYR